MTINELGKVLKRKFPQYDHLTDHDAGQLLLKKYPEYKSRLDGALGATIGMEMKRVPVFAQHAKNRMLAEEEYNTALHQHATFIDNLKKIENEKQVNENRTQELAESTHVVSLSVNRQATSLGVDAPTASAIRLLQEQTQLEINKFEAQEKIRVDMLRKTEEIKIATYAQEANIDFQAVEREQLLPHERVLAISNHLKHLVIERAEIENSNKSDSVKQKLLGIQDGLIETFQKNLNDQMARHLLQTPDEKDMEGKS